MAQDYLKRMESETQTTDIENNAFLQEYDEIWQTWADNQDH